MADPRSPASHPFTSEPGSGGCPPRPTSVRLVFKQELYKPYILFRNGSGESGPQRVCALTGQFLMTGLGLLLLRTLIETQGLHRGHHQLPRDTGVVGKGPVGNPAFPFAMGATGLPVNGGWAVGCD